MKQPAAIAALRKMGGVRRLTDANLEDLHDFALIALVRCQDEMQRRGIPGTVLVQRTEGISLLSTNPGSPPLCRCILAAFTNETPAKRKAAS